MQSTVTGKYIYFNLKSIRKSVQITDIATLFSIHMRDPKIQDECDNSVLCDTSAEKRRFDEGYECSQLYKLRQNFPRLCTSVTGISTFRKKVHQSLPFVPLKCADRNPDMKARATLISFSAAR